MISGFHRLPPAVEDQQLRSQVDHYFRSRLGKEPGRKEIAKAAQDTIARFPDLIDFYIKQKEECGDEARVMSSAKTEDLHAALVAQVKRAIPDLESRTEFYEKPWTSYQEALDRVSLFKHYVENQDGYRLMNRAGEPFSRETDVQLFFGLIWCKSDFDVNREPNNGRGPVDFKVSFGSGDKSLIEFKLASNSSLKRNLERQVEIYEKANKTNTSVKVIVCYTAEDQEKVDRVLRELDLIDNESVVVIDARSDNKPSASKA